MHPKIYFIDTEFNGLDGQLLSMALVPLNLSNPQFYYELQCEETFDPWVLENVVGKFTGPVLEYREFQTKLEAFLESIGDILIIADWPDDVSYLTKVMITGPGTAIKTPLVTVAIDRRIEGESTVPHHALFDALANRQYYITNILKR